MISGGVALDPSQEDGRVLRARALREERKRQILAAARRLFAERGYVGTSIADIIDAAGIARGTFYLHYESKRSLFGEILEGLIRELSDVLVRVDVHSPVSPFDQLLTNVERVLEVAAAHRDVVRVLLRNESGHDLEFRQKLEEFHAHALELIKGSLSEGVAMKLVRPVDLDTYATCVLGSIKETVDRRLLDQRLSPEEQKQIARQLLDYNLRGVLAG